MEHTLYIVGPSDGSAGHYQLVADTGEVLAGHYCSDRGFARFDVHDRRTQSHQEWRDQFGEYIVLWIGEDDLVEDELIRRNRELCPQPAASGGTGEGTAND